MRARALRHVSLSEAVSRMPGEKSLVNGEIVKWLQSKNLICFVERSLGEGIRRQNEEGKIGRRVRKRIGILASVGEERKVVGGSGKVGGGKTRKLLELAGRHRKGGRCWSVLVNKKLAAGSTKNE